MTSAHTWRKSSFSGGEGGQCVEVRGDHEAVRDTKNPTVVLTVSASAWASLTRSLRIGQLG